MAHSPEPAKVTGDDLRTLGNGVTALVVFIIAGLIFLFASDLDDWVRAKRLAAVEEGAVYRSAQLSPVRLEGVLDDLNIRRIIRLTANDPKDDWQQIELFVADKMDIDVEVHHLMGNGTGDPAIYIDVLESMYVSRANGEPVLVHCATGSQRTGVASLLWQVLLLDVPVDDAIDDLLWYNHRPHRNGALKPYLRRYIPRITAELQARGIPARDITEDELAQLPLECPECADRPEPVEGEIPEYSEDCYGCDLWPVTPQVAAAGPTGR
ncbi:MAG: tyrosine-protein phosphatase [Planctomycetota bacterium]